MCQLLRRVVGKEESFMLEKLGVPERMNVLLVHEEVLSLLEGDDGTTLMTQYKEGAQQEGWMLKSTEELYDWFFLSDTIIAVASRFF